MGTDAISVNMAQCNKCGERLRSVRINDPVRCECGNLAIQGGDQFIARSVKGSSDSWRELSIRRDGAIARNSDPRTSHDAAASARDAGPRIRAAIIAVFEQRHVNGLPSVTDERLVELIVSENGARFATPQGIRSRRAEIARDGLIEEGLTGKTGTGRNCKTWRRADGC